MSADAGADEPASPGSPRTPGAEPAKTEAKREKPALAPVAAPADRSQLVAYAVIWAGILAAVAYLMSR